jgi:hypothetical protein
MDNPLGPKVGELVQFGHLVALAARGAQLVDFSFRHTQGIEAGLAAARASAIAGFAATSNIEAARRYGLTAAGTMAHSFIEAFGAEDRAFAACPAWHRKGAPQIPLPGICEEPCLCWGKASARIQLSPVPSRPGGGPCCWAHFS